MRRDCSTDLTLQAQSRLTPDVPSSVLAVTAQADGAECIHLQVTGAGTEKLPTAEMVSIPGDRQPRDPGLVADIYSKRLTSCASLPLRPPLNLADTIRKPVVTTSLTISWTTRLLDLWLKRRRQPALQIGLAQFGWHASAASRSARQRQRNVRMLSSGRSDLAAIRRRQIPSTPPRRHRNARDLCRRRPAALRPFPILLP